LQVDRAEPGLQHFPRELLQARRRIRDRASKCWNLHSWASPTLLIAGIRKPTPPAAPSHPSDHACPTPGEVRSSFPLRAMAKINLAPASARAFSCWVFNDGGGGVGGWHVILDNLNTHKPRNDRWLRCAGAIALVIMAVVGQCPAVRELEIALCPLQRLDRGLLVNADDDGVLGRCHVEPDHIGGPAEAATKVAAAYVSLFSLLAGPRTCARVTMRPAFALCPRRMWT
jgi:hypothetical protein